MGKRIDAARRIKADILAALDVYPKASERYKDIIRRVLSGETYSNVGADYGLGREGVRRACFVTFRKMGFKL